MSNKSINSTSSAKKPLPKLIAKFKKEKAALISEFTEDLQVQFAFAVATCGSIKEDQSLSIEQFVEFMLTKKVRFNSDDINSIMGTKSTVKNDEFIDLLVLASCGGLHNKLGTGNFMALMQHMGVSQKVQVSEFDSGRDTDD